MTGATDGELETTEDEEPETGDEEKPEIGTESAIDLTAVDEAIQNDTDEDDAEDRPESDDADTSDDSSDGDLAGGGRTFGDHYVTGLCTVSNAVIEHYGEEDAVGVDEQMARDLELDAAMDEWIRSKGVTEEMPPGQALLIATLMFLVAALASNPAVVNGLLDELGGTTE